MTVAPPRVLHVLDSLDRGGTEQNAVRVIRELAARGIPVHLAVFRDGPLRRELDASQVPVDLLRVPSLRSVGALREAWKLRDFLGRHGVSLLHTHDRYSNAFGVMVRLAGARVPWLASKRWDSRADPLLMRWAGSAAYRLSTGVLANARAVAETLERDDGVRPERITIVPNFVDDEVWAADRDALRRRLRAELGLADDRFVMVCVANLRPVKNHRLLIEVLASIRAAVPGAMAVLVGDGPERAALERMAAERGVAAQVHFAGTRDAAWRFHAAGDISVLCSDSEGFPNALLEAQALGVPVVATDVGGVSEVVEDGVSGLLCGAGNASEMERAIGALAADPARRQAMGSAARSSARRRYAREPVIDALIHLYQRLGS